MNVEAQTEIPAPDPHLGDWQCALNPDAMAAQIDRHLLGGSDQSWRVEWCRPTYVKYNPSRYCFIQYDLAVREVARDTTTRTFAYVALLRDDRARRESNSPALRRLTEQATAVQRLPAYACYLPELRASLQVYPVDSRLPGLVQVASPDAVNAQLQNMVTEPRQPISCVQQVELVRYKPGRRAVLRYQLAGGGLSTDNSSRHLYGKLRSDERGIALLNASRALAAAGVATPPPLAYLPDLRMLVQAEAQGTRLKDLRGTIEYNRWLGPVADALAELHTTRLSSQVLSRFGDDLLELAVAAQTVSALLPHLGQETTRLSHRIAAALSEVQNAPGAAHAIVHGSFHDDQVLVGPDGTGVSLVDLDSIGLGHPLSDVGHFLAYLTADGAPEQAHSHFFDAYVDACRQRHTGVSATAARQALLFEAATLLRWCTLPFRELDLDWPIQVERRIALATRRLAEYEQRIWASVPMVPVS